MAQNTNKSYESSPVENFGYTVTIYDSISEIGYCTYNGYRGLRSVIIPRSVIKIEGNAFEDCSDLTNITVHPDNPAHASVDGVLFNEDRTELLIFPRGRQGDYVVPDSVTKINQWTFSGCSALTSITLPDTVAEIGSYAFADCHSLTCINIPNSVTKIEEGTFCDCRSLTSVTIPDSVIEIKGVAFSGCFSLTAITALPGNPVYASHDGVLFNKDKTELLLCPRGKRDYIIPDSVVKIGRGAFEGCSYLGSVTIPNSVTVIGEGAFYGCMSLSSVVISESVTEIGDYAFDSCYNLSAVTVPKSVVKMGNNVFSGCISLPQSNSNSI